MALVKTENIAAQTRGFHSISMVRQLGLMVGLAASVALGVAVVMWSQVPNYRLLYGDMSMDGAGEVVRALEQSGIKYQLSADSSAVLVEGDRLTEARMTLAEQGLPKVSGMSFENLKEDQGFGVSQFMENARFQRALEGELARSISSINTVRSARVHLAVPKRTAFVRGTKNPTASVIVDIYAGRVLTDGQVMAISHMVSSSIPSLNVEDVTIIDQRGRLLTSGSQDTMVQRTSSQFEYVTKVEAYYSKRIEDIISPFVGEGGVRAKVAADIDFTTTEQTQESFNPDMPSIRSEFVQEEQHVGSGSANAGVPGSLSNQVPTDSGSEAESGGGSSNRSKRSTRNYELDRTISHVNTSAGKVRRLSIAIVVDDVMALNADEELVRTPLSDDQMARINSLAKEVVGFDAKRGDSINVINSSFTVPTVPEPLPEASLMDSPALWDGLKQAGGAALVIFLIFGVLRPVLRDLATKGKSAQEAGALAEGAAPGEMLTLGNPGVVGNAGVSYETNMATAQSLASQDPKRAAQVVSNWVGSDAG